jgi:hypothetical protein
MSVLTAVQQARSKTDICEEWRMRKYNISK